MATEYRRWRVGAVWHWQPACEWWPILREYRNKAQAVVISRDKPMAGRLCHACLVLEGKADAD